MPLVAQYSAASIEICTFAPSHEQDNWFHYIPTGDIGIKSSLQPFGEQLPVHPPQLGVSEDTFWESPMEVFLKIDSW